VALTDGVWIFRPDREWDRGAGTVQSPHDTLNAAWYKPIAPGTVDTVVVSDHARLVSVGAHALKGQYFASDPTRLWFELTSGMTGGRFVVWHAGSGFQAELTFYGSGLPILKSVRGALVSGP
jgi:hypothetical protein